MTLLVGLHPAQDVGPDQIAQRAVGVVRPLGQGLGGAAELLRASEQAGIDEVEDRPQVAEVVFHRRSGQGDPCFSLQGLGGARLLGVGVLDRLRLVQHHEAPGRFSQHRQAQQRAIAGDHQVQARQSLHRHLIEVFGRHRRGMHDLRVQLGGEALDLRRPVGQQRCRSDQQARLVLGSLPLLDQQQRQDLDRLAQTHVVGQAGAKPEPAQQVEPFDARLLVRAQAPLQGRPRINAGTVGVAQRLQRLSQPRSGRDVRPVGNRGGLVVPGGVGAGQQAHGLGKGEPLLFGELLHLLEAAHRPVQTRTIDLHPLATQQRQRLGPSEQCGHFLGGERLTLQGHVHVEVEQGIKACPGWRTGANRGGDLRAGRAARAPMSGQAHDHTGAFQVGHAVQEPCGVSRTPA